MSLRLENAATPEELEALEQRMRQYRLATQISYERMCAQLAVSISTQRKIYGFAPGPVSKDLVFRVNKTLDEWCAAEKTRENGAPISRIPSKRLTRSERTRSRNR